MRIVLIGQAAFGKEVLQALLDEGEEVVAVYTPPDLPGGKPNPFKEAAERLGIPLYQPKRMRDPEVFAGYIKLKPDLNVMAFVTDIAPRRILDCPRYKTIEYHPSLLPKHRGGSAINWAIIKGEAKTGLTIFWVDEGIDTGPILLQKEVDISPDDTVGSLYFNKLFPLGVEAIVEAVRLIKEGKAPRIPQDESQATYEGLCAEEDAIIDWAQPAQQVYNLIRGTDPQPGATTEINGQPFKVFDSRLLPAQEGKAPGEIVEIAPGGMLVVANGGAILIGRVQPRGLPKMAPQEAIELLNLRPGARLG